jgi:hypothetical protein
MVGALLLFATLKGGTTSILEKGKPHKKLTMAGLVVLSGYCNSGNCVDVGVDLTMVASTALAVCSPRTRVRTFRGGARYGRSDFPGQGRPRTSQERAYRPPPQQLTLDAPAGLNLAALEQGTLRLKRRKRALRGAQEATGILQRFNNLGPWSALVARRLRHMSINKQTTAYHEPGHAAADSSFGFNIKQDTIVSRVLQVQ